MSEQSRTRGYGARDCGWSGGVTRSGLGGTHAPRPGEEVGSPGTTSPSRRAQPKTWKVEDREERVHDESLSERSNLKGESKEGDQEDGNGLSYVVEGNVEHTA